MRIFSLATNGKRINAEAMEKRIFELLREHKIGHVKAWYLTHELLRLYDVVGRSEQLLAFGWYMMEHSNDNDGKTAKDCLQDFLSQ